MKRNLQFPLLLVVALLLCGVSRVPAQDIMTGRPQLRGFLFGDVVYAARDNSSLTDGFFIGQLVGHGNATLSERVSFFGELSATARPDGYAFEVERAILRYDFNDLLKLSVGRYHTAISYWNTAFHHGLWLQTSVSRPEIIKVGGRFLPVHFVGAVAEGSLSTSGFGIVYEAGVGNGRGTNLARGGDAGDNNLTRAYVLSARVRPGHDLGLQVGGSAYLDRISVTSGLFDERIATGHIVWNRGAPELALEYANVRHEGPADETFDSDGWYAHAGLRLPGNLSHWKPYVRAERLDVAAGDPAFGAAIPDYRAYIAGIRYEFDILAALKAEYRRERFAGGTELNSLFLQVAFALGHGGM
ncbi:MAG: hypothetical protein WEE89_06500 [Gemmatimonadota bacterium]